MFIKIYSQTGEVIQFRENEHYSGHPVLINLPNENPPELVVNYDNDQARPASIADLTGISVGDFVTLTKDQSGAVTAVTGWHLDHRHHQENIALVEESKHDPDANSDAVDALAKETCAIVDQRIAETAEGSDERAKWQAIKTECAQNHTKRNYQKFAREVEEALEASVEAAFDERATDSSRHWDEASTDRIVEFLYDFGQALRIAAVPVRAITGAEMTDYVRERYLAALDGQTLTKAIITQSAADVATSAQNFAAAINAQDDAVGCSRLTARVAIEATPRMLDDEPFDAWSGEARRSFRSTDIAPLRFNGGYASLPENEQDSVEGERVLTITAAANATLTLAIEGEMERTIDPGSAWIVQHAVLQDRSFTLTASVPAPAIATA